MMRRASTAVLLTCAAIGVATGLLIIPATAVSVALSPTLPPLAAITTGAWVIGYVIALRLLERPGVGILTGLLSGLIAAPLSASGLAIVITNVLFAFMIELPFLITLYRRWSTWLYYAGTGFTALLYAVWSGFAADMAAFPASVVAAYMVVTVAGALFATWLGILTADRLRRAGVARVARRRPEAGRVAAAPPG